MPSCGIIQCAAKKDNIHKGLTLHFDRMAVCELKLKEASSCLGCQYLPGTDLSLLLYIISVKELERALDKIKFVLHNLLFPTNDLMREKWMSVIGEDNIRPACRSRPYICSLHFQEKCFNRMTQRTRLRPDAMPTLELPKKIIVTQSRNRTHINTVINEAVKLAESIQKTSAPAHRPPLKIEKVQSIATKGSTCRADYNDTTYAMSATKGSTCRADYNDTTYPMSATKGSTSRADYNDIYTMSSTKSSSSRADYNDIYTMSATEGSTCRADYNDTNPMSATEGSTCRADYNETYPMSATEGSTCRADDIDTHPVTSAPLVIVDIPPGPPPPPVIKTIFSPVVIKKSKPTYDANNESRLLSRCNVLDKMLRAWRQKVRRRTLIINRLEAEKKELTQQHLKTIELLKSGDNRDHQFEDILHKAVMKLS